MNVQNRITNSNHLSQNHIFMTQVSNFKSSSVVITQSVHEFHASINNVNININYLIGTEVNKTAE
jgi:hypothetical protein